MDNDSIFIEHLTKVLSKYVPDGFSIKAMWYMAFLNDFQDNPLNDDDNILYLIVDKQPTANVGNVNVQNVTMTMLVASKYLSVAMDVLLAYQMNAFNNKDYYGDVVLSEAYYSPSVSQNFLAIAVENYSEITMNGSVYFGKNLLDISSLKMLNCNINYLDVQEGYVTQPLNQALATNGSYDNLTKTLNQCATTNYTIRLWNESNSFTQLLRDLKWGKEDINFKVKMSMTFTDTNETFERNVVITSITTQYSSGNVPITTIIVGDAR